MMTNDQLLKQYCEYLRMMGHCVVQTSSALWIDVRSRIFQPAPPFHLPRIDKQEIRQVFKETNAIACRWFSTANTPAQGGRATTLFVAHAPYDVAHLPHRARHQTRRGLERVEIRRQEMDDAVESLAFAIYSENVRKLRLMRNDAAARRWKTWAKVIREAPGVELWTAWSEKRMVAFAVTIDTPWGTEFVLTRSRPAELNLYPNNALIYTVTKEALARGASQVSLGLSCYGESKPGLDRFKVNIGYQAIPLKENQTWHPVVQPFGSLLRPEWLRGMYRLVSRASS